MLLGTVLLTSCSKKERSEIELVKLDKEFIEGIRSKYDSTYLESRKKGDTWTIEHYWTRPTIEKMIVKDSLDNINAIVIQENEKYIFAQEYYPNGQAKGKIGFVSGKVDGPVVYYNEDGRIWSKGQYASDMNVGEWKKYDKDGYLVSIKYYDDKGQLEKEETIK
jgi:hypothetical protein